MTKAPISLQELRRRIYRKAKSDKTHRFWGLFVHITKIETLEEAYRIAKPRAMVVRPALMTRSLRTSRRRDGRHFWRKCGKIFSQADTKPGRTAGWKFRKGTENSERFRSPVSATAWSRVR